MHDYGGFGVASYIFLFLSLGGGYYGKEPLLNFFKYTICWDKRIVQIKPGRRCVANATDSTFFKPLLPFSFRTRERKNNMSHVRTFVLSRKAHSLHNHRQPTGQEIVISCQQVKVIALGHDAADSGSSRNPNDSRSSRNLPKAFNYRVIQCLPQQQVKLPLGIIYTK